ncbi:MAG: capsular polysaccharide biosynthesis protein, partial [Aquificaceae bacterium]
SFSERDVLVVWGSKSRRRIEDVIKGDPKILTVEDGFIRSYGLGADFVPPMSLVFDSRGIYYDPSKESDLEHILNYYPFSKKELEEAEEIRRSIVEKEITKYNLISERKLKVNTWKKVILVVGQVEDDEALLLGGGSIRTNIQLLRRVRELNPDDHIIFKPHPDVLSKNRGSFDLSLVKKLADSVETEADIISCIKVAGEVHVLSSLSGFEALIREKKVFVYGAPFYAGWGLTQDHMTLPRRKRRLTLQELIAGTLLVYPVYYDWTLKGFVDCKTVINRILYERSKNKKHIKTDLPKPIKKMLNYIGFIKWKLSMQ